MIQAVKIRWQQLLVAIKLWWLGLWEAFQLQRCTVFAVLDDDGVILKKLTGCFILNGGVFLGSIILHTQITKPLCSWMLTAFVERLSGPAVARAISTALSLLFQISWLIPAYVVTLIISSKWYQEIATAAYKVRQKQKVPLQQQQNPGTSAIQQTATPGARSGARGSNSPLEDVAHEVYRGVFFMVFYCEVMLLAQIPYLGPPVNFVFLSWLYAYYCYDYLWSLQGVKLPERLAHFERSWAFFAGFGCPSVLATFCFSFYTGAALLALLFPLFILVASNSDPPAVHSRVPLALDLGRVPIFAIAQRPTSWLLKLVFGSVGRAHAQ